MAGTRGVPGGPKLFATLGALALGLAIAAPASAAGLVKERFDYALEFLGNVDCGSFEDHYIDRYQVTETDVYDAEHNLLRIEYQAVHTSVDRNSVTGFTLEEHGHFHEVDDFVAGTITLSGNQEIANRLGQGVVIQDTGHQVLSMDTGELLFFAGGRKHSQWLLGEGIWCDALS
jgi:hypothetical protein